MYDGGPDPDQEQPPVHQAGIGTGKEDFHELGAEQQAEGAVNDDVFQVLRHGERGISYSKR